MNTETGTPVQYLEWSVRQQHWNILPAVISEVNESKVNILILSHNSREYADVRHEDFKVEGKDYWRFLPNKDGGQFTNIVKP